MGPTPGRAGPWVPGRGAPGEWYHHPAIPHPPPASGLSCSVESPCTQAARQTRLYPTRGHLRARTHIPTPQCTLIESPQNLSRRLRVEGRRGSSPSRPPGNHGNSREAGSRRKAARARVLASVHPRLVKAAAAPLAPTWAEWAPSPPETLLPHSNSTTLCSPPPWASFPLNRSKSSRGFPHLPPSLGQGGGPSILRQGGPWEGKRSL